MMLSVIVWHVSSFESGHKMVICLNGASKQGNFYTRYFPDRDTLEKWLSAQYAHVSFINDNSAVMLITKDGLGEIVALDLMTHYTLIVTDNLDTVDNGSHGVMNELGEYNARINFHNQSIYVTKDYYNGKK